MSAFFTPPNLGQRAAALDCAALPALILRYRSRDHRTDRRADAALAGIQPKKPPEFAGGLMFRLDVGSTGPVPALARNVPSVRYADIAGQETALEQLKNVVELPLTHQAYFEALRVAPQSGVILYGPPGNGKTLLAKAVATESNATRIRPPTEAQAFHADALVGMAQRDRMKCQGAKGACQ